ncbi:hypothetical protein FRB90_002032, partial [Tulasnella sp. 427]
ARFASGLESRDEGDGNDEESKLLLGPIFRERLPSKFKFKRDALCVNIVSPASQATLLRLINVHLDSLEDIERHRPEQMKILADVLRQPGCGRRLVAGDFNDIGPQDKGLLEKNKLVDAWIKLYGTTGSDGNTWSVGMLWDDGLKPGRLDKVAMFGASIHSNDKLPSRVPSKDLGRLQQLVDTPHAEHVDTMHHALTIPEVMQMILSSGVSRGTKRNAALTCRSWKEPALDQLWRTLDSIVPLLRFRPSGRDLLPNLRQFTFDASYASRAVDTLPLFLPFLGASLVNIELRAVDPVQVSHFLGYLAARSSSIQDLKIRWQESSSSHSSDALAFCLRQLEKLKFLDVSSIHLTPSVWDAMADHRNLLFASFSTKAPAHVHAITGFRAKVFSNLERLILQANYDFLGNLFSSQDELPTLTRIVFEGAAAEPQRKDFGRICELLSQKLPNLDFVWLGCHSNEGQGEEGITFQEIRPLLRLPKVRLFHVEHPCGVSLTSSEVGELLDAWPRLTNLALQYSDDCVDSRGHRTSIRQKIPPLPLSVLSIVAEKRPQIKELSLILNAKTPRPMPAPVVRAQFEALEKLGLSLSFPGTPTDVASYLVHLFKKRITLNFIIPKYIPGNSSGIIKKHETEWHEIGEYLSVLLNQKERLEKEFGRRLEEERARHARELRAAMAQTSFTTAHE